jgi:hypothetical protein
MDSVGLLANRRRARLALGCALAGALAGCSSIPAGQSTSDTLANIFAFNSPTAPPAQARKAETSVNCPIVDVAEGGAAVRVYAGGQSNENVRYQYSLGDLARECSVENNQLVMKVGVEGQVLLGPRGAPGAFNVPVKVSVRREADEKILDTKIYRASVTIPSGSAQAPFSIVTDPIAVPYLGENAYDDYMVFVALDGTGARLPPSKRRRR